MSWGELLEAHLECLRLRGFSAASLTCRRNWVRRLADWAGRRGLAPGQVAPSDLAAYQRSLLWEPGLKGRLLAANTVHHALAQACCFFAWAAEAGHLVADPAEGLVLPRPPQALPTLLTEEEVARLLEAPVLTTPLGLRDRAVLETFYATAVRRSECCGLDLGDYDRARSELRVRGKGGLERLVPTGEALGRTLERYLEQGRPKWAGPSESALFVCCRGHRLAPGMANLLVRRSGRAAGIAAPVTCHLLRHACATHLLHNGADIRQIQELLGHRRVTSTERYLHLFPRELTREHERTHPRARRGKGCD